MHGRVVHFEIPADDPERAEAFYRDIFGWQAEPIPDGGYTLVSTGPSGERGPTESGYINGGLMPRNDENPSHPVVVIGVDDIDKTLEQVESSGGKMLIPKLEVMGIGWAAYFTDPEGNITGLWQSAQEA